MDIQNSFQMIIDLSYHITKEMIQKLLVALHNSLEWILNLKSNEEKYYIGISGIHNNFCRIQPLKFFEGNYNYNFTLKQIETMLRTASQINDEEYNDLLHIAVKSALDDYNSFFKRVKQTDYNTDENFRKEKQLKIILITNKTSHDFRSKLEIFDNLLPGNDIKYIRVLKIQTNEEIRNTRDIENNLSTTAVTEIEELEILDIHLESSLKKCFFEPNCFIGRLTLLMSEIVLYCDMTSFMININNDTNIYTSYYNLFASSQKLCNEYHMEVTNKIVSEGICESHIYGFPIKLTPATHIKLDDPDRYTANKQIFAAISKSLLESDEYLILKYTHYKELLTTNYFFMLRPGYKDMLMKALIPSELLLPEIKKINGNSQNNPFSLVNKETDLVVSHSLEKITAMNTYNPGNFRAGLQNRFAQLQSQTNKVKRRQLLPTFSNKLDTSIDERVADIMEKKRKQSLTHTPPIKSVKLNEKPNISLSQSSFGDCYLGFKTFNDLNRAEGQECAAEVKDKQSYPDRNT